MTKALTRLFEAQAGQRICFSRATKSGFLAPKPIYRYFIQFVYCKPLNGYLANIEDPDEMQPYAAFHRGLHSLLRFKQPLRDRNASLFKNLYL